MSAVVYCRVSTKEQVKNLSLTTQQARCIDFCSQNTRPVIKIFRDEGESAKTADRPAFQEMLAFCKSKKNVVAYVVVHDLSRFSRDMGDQVSVIGQLKAAGVRLRSVMENVDETAAGRLMSNIYGAFNQFDNDRKSERTKLGMQRAATMGRFPHKAALGYINLRNESGPNLIPDPDRAPLILKGFELFGEGNRTKAETLRLLNLLGLRTLAGRELTPQTFEKILRNPIYAGWIVLPKWGMRERGSFQSLVPDELFNRVQGILDGKRLAVTPHSRNNPDFPLRVFVRCGDCGTPLTGSWSSGRRKKYAYYRCRKSQCRAVNVKRDLMEKAFYDLLEKQTAEAGFMGLFREIVNGLWQERQKLSIATLRVVTQRLASLRQRKNRLVEFLLDGRLDQQTYEEQAHLLHGECAESEDELRRADLEHIEVEAILDFAEGLLSRPHQIWFAASLEQKQRLQKVFFPSGLQYTNDGFGTASTSSIFRTLRSFNSPIESFASPTRFELVLSP